MQVEATKIEKGKRNFLIFFFSSLCLWIAPFLIRLLIGDYEDPIVVPNIDKSQISNPIYLILERIKDGNKFLAFKLIFWNNFKVCVLNILGGAMLGILTVLSLIKNGFYTGGIVINALNYGLNTNEILKYTLPHSIELIGIWYSGTVGFCFAKMIIDYMRIRIVPSLFYIMFLGKTVAIIFILILIAAFVEVYVSMSIFLK